MEHVPNLKFVETSYFIKFKETSFQKMITKNNEKNNNHPFSSRSSFSPVKINWT